MNLPHAHYDLATHQDLNTHQRYLGVVSRSFLGPTETMIHGNEVLAELDPTYPLHETYRARRHTVGRVLEALRGFGAPRPICDLAAPDVFIGYLLLDAWIGNTDRHHENWGLLHGPHGARLAPTFDHATCLGRELRLSEIQDRLTTRDERRTVEAYARRARSAFYAEGADAKDKPLSPIEAWRIAAEATPSTTEHWLRTLDSIHDEAIIRCIARVPDDRIEPERRDFAMKILELNRARVLNG